MKTEEELAKDEKNRLEKLEHQRLERMSRLSDTINNGDNNNISGDYDVRRCVYVCVCTYVCVYCVYICLCVLCD